MILDGLLMFSQAQSVAQAVGTYDSTNIIDLGITGLPTSASGGGARDIGIGDDPAMEILCEIVTGVTSGGAGTLQATLSGAPDNGAGAPGTYTILTQSPVVALASLGVGARILNQTMPSLPAGCPLPRFLKMSYVVAGATLTAGAVSAGLVLDRYDQVRGPTGLDSAYPPGIVIAN